MADPLISPPASDDDFDEIAIPDEGHGDELAVRFLAVRRRQLPLDDLDFDRIVFGLPGAQAAEAARVKLCLLADIKVSTIDIACGLTLAQWRKLHLAGEGDVKRLFDRIAEKRADWRVVDGTIPPAAYRDAIDLRNTVNSGHIRGQSLFKKTLDGALTAEQRALCSAFGGIERLVELIWIRTSTDAAPTIREIRLSGTPFSDDGMARLESMTTLQTLHLVSTRITDTGLRFLGSLTNLENLDLERTRVDGSGLAHLRRLQRLKALHLGHTRCTDGSLAHLGWLTGLKSLKLDSTHVTGRGLTGLKSLPQLEVLSLCDTQVSDAGLAELSDLKLLRELDLGATKITDAGLAHLGGLTSLRVLDLRRAAITDAGLAPLKGLANLKFVYLYGTRVTEAGMSDLQGALRGAKVIR